MTKQGGTILLLLVLTVVALGGMPLPAVAHGEEGELEAVELVEQALAIVVNTPEAVGEALERVEEALAVVAEEPSDELDAVALRQAVDALQAGDLHEAEDALVLALGVDPHGDSAATTSPAEATVSEPAVTFAEETVSDEEPASDEEPSREASSAPSHGLTDRVEGGLRTPSGEEVAALVAAAAVAAFGLGLAFGRKGVRS